MKLININTQDDIELKLYPDNQPHIKLLDVDEGDKVHVICSIRSSLEMMYLLECANAIDNAGGKKSVLTIPYLMAARFDRQMEVGDSVDLKVVADMINYCNFKRVQLFDVHSDVALMAINRSENLSNYMLVDRYRVDNSVLICPDAGAVKKVDKYLSWKPRIKEVVYCNKTRDLSNGMITLRVLEPDKCTDRDCVIIDDLCDGGGTFLGIASQIVPKSLTLIVTHGIFSKGFSELEQSFDKIITSNSYRQSYNSNIVEVVPHPF
jgi:ribose-phosphate pyrophosphokinase